MIILALSAAAPAEKVRKAGWARSTFFFDRSFGLLAEHGVGLDLVFAFAAFKMFCGQGLSREVVTRIDIA